MKFPLNITLCFLFLIFKLNAQNHTEINISISENINGTIVKPANESKSNLIILIGGSGPTDRNGNQSFARCDVLKKLAHYFSDYGISSFRYDKRIVTQIRNGNIDKNIMFDDFVNDAKSIIDFFKDSLTAVSEFALLSEVSIIFFKSNSFLSCSFFSEGSGSLE